MDESIGEELPNHRLGCFLQYQGKFVDAIMIQEGSQRLKADKVTFNLDEQAEGEEEPNLVIICKDI